MHFVQIVEGDASPPAAPPSTGNWDREGIESMQCTRGDKYEWISEEIRGEQI